MIKLSRGMKRRGWYAGLIAIWLLPFAFASLAWAVTATVSAESTGWLWKNRQEIFIGEVQPDPVGVPGGVTTTTVGGELGVGGDAYCYNVPSANTQPCQVQWPVEHLYVGWNGSANPPQAEMITGINFDLAKIPFGSTITRFILSLQQHPGGTNYGNSPSHNNTSNYAAIVEHGIVACPWPEFFAGSHADAWDTDLLASRQCAQAVTGSIATSTVTTTVDSPQYGDPRNLVTWKFDLSVMAQDWASGENPAISVEPNPSKKPLDSWVTSFHTSSYETNNSPDHADIDNRKPPTPGVRIPGLWADVIYSLPVNEPEEEDGGGGLGGGNDGEFGGDPSGFGGFGTGSFGSSPGLAVSLGAEGAGDTGTGEPQGRVLAFGEGKPADFWDIPLPVWIALILGFILIASSGWLLQLEPIGGRPPGAADALMRG